MKKTVLTFAALLALAGSAQAVDLTVPHTFSPGTPIKSSDVNDNFLAILNELKTLRSRVSTIESCNISCSGKKIYYSENFTYNPNYTSLSPTNVYWDATQGIYYAKTYDNLVEKYWAYSPSFSEKVPASQKNVTIEFDIKFDKQVFGTYPGIRFYDGTPTEISGTGFTNKLTFMSAYATNQTRWLEISDNSGNFYNTTAADDNKWYHVKIDYKFSTHKADIVVTARADGAVFYSNIDANLSLSDFDHLAIGFYDNPNYGNDWSPINVDNIIVRDS